MHKHADYLYNEGIPVLLEAIHGTMLIISFIRLTVRIRYNIAWEVLHKLIKCNIK